MTNWLGWLGRSTEDASLRDPLSPLSSPTIPTMTIERAAWLFVGIGLLARLIRFYLCFPLWDDESFLCVNFIARSYAELMMPLDYHQVAPLLFLWMERLMVRVFGFSEYALRLVPFACSIVSLFAFRRVAGCLLSGPGYLFAVAIFAVSYPGIRYAAEAKPYCTDLFVSLLMLLAVVRWRDTRDVRILSILAILMPLAMGLSYPAVFAAVGMGLCVAWVLSSERGTRTEWISWVAWNASIVVSFVVWFHIVGRIQNAAESQFMGEYWKENFPPISQPWMLPYWMIKIHASDFLAYPFGGPNWASTATFLICCAGLYRLIRQSQIFTLALLVMPAGLHWVAAALQRYPYGGHVKFSQYLAPMICVTAGVGLAQLLEWRSRLGYSERRSLAWCGAILMLIGLSSVGRDLVNPYKTRSDFRARAFAQSFWVGAHSAEEVACLKSDLGLDFVPEQHRELSWSAHYLCNRAIEVARSSLKPVRFEKVSGTRPLRCVIYRDARYALDQERLDRWLEEMSENYELVGHEQIPFPRLAKNERTLVTMEYVDSYKFIPRTDNEKDSPPIVGQVKSPLN